jgi:hypothetical protein
MMHSAYNIKEKNSITEREAFLNG